VSEQNIPENPEETPEETEVEAHLGENILGLQKLKAENASAPGMVAPGSTGSCGIQSCS
jgi:hypothetical protein